MTRTIAVLVLGLLCGPAQTLARPVGQPPQEAPPKPAATANTDPVAEAYFQFMLGRTLESDGDVDAAVKAYTRAMALDPSSADIPAELSALYARQGRIRDSVAMAESALAIDPDHAEANRILGSIFAQLSEQEVGSTTPGASNTDRAIGFLERALKKAADDRASSIRLNLGRLYLQTEAVDKAIPVLRRLLADEPWLPQGVALLADAYKAAGRTTDAVALLEGAVLADPSFYGALGEAYEQEERWSDAATAYGEAVSANPRDTSLQTRWAYSLLNVGRPEDLTRARDLLNDVTKANPTSSWPLYLLSRAQRATGDLDGAEQSARRLLALSPGSVSGAHALAQVLSERREYAKLVEALAPVLAKVPEGRDADVALLQTHLGFAYQALGESGKAVDAFERAAALDPSNEDQSVYLGQALVEAKRFDKALSYVRMRRTVRPDDVRLARIEAEALRGQGKLEEGAALLRPIAEAADAPAAAVQSYAEYYASARRYADAAAILARAQARFPDDADLVFQLAAMREREGRVDDAERLFREVLALEPEHGPALNYLGYSLVDRTGRVEEGLALIKRAVDLDPYNGAYLDSLGWAYFKLGRLDEAERHLAVAARQLPRDSVVQDHWGDLLAGQGRLAEAVAAWRQSLKGDGEGIERKTVERKIKDTEAKLGRR